LCFGPIQTATTVSRRTARPILRYLESANFSVRTSHFTRFLREVGMSSSAPLLYFLFRFRFFSTHIRVRFHLAHRLQHSLRLVFIVLPNRFLRNIHPAQ
jgi:hypothetical protein